MTEDYKKNLLEYITNTVNQTQPTTDEIFEEIIEPSKWENIFPEGATQTKYTGMIGANELTSNLTILYGGYRPSAGDFEGRGIITLVDNNFNPVKTILQYESGTYLRYIQHMEQAEDGTFYMVDDAEVTNTNLSWTSSVKRFVMVNNFSVINELTNDYTISLRKSYIFGSSYRNFLCKAIFKNPNSSHYFMAGHALSSNDQKFDITTAIDLKINVGSSNEWKINNSSDNYMYGGSYATFNSNDNVEWKILLTDSDSQNSNIYLWSKAYAATNPSSSVLVTLDHDAFISSYFYSNQCCFISSDKVYFVSDSQRKNTYSSYPRYLGLYSYEISTSTLTTIYEKLEGTTYVSATGELILVVSNQNDVYTQYCQNIQQISGKVYADYYAQRLVNDTWNPLLVAAEKHYYPTGMSFYVNNKFNLLQMWIYYNTKGNYYQALVKEIYNPLNYNGEPYVDYNALIPQQATIYSNNSLVFARNLYNQTIYDNVTTSTVVVPNNYLNDITLTQNNLLSETNVTMVTQNQPYTKNMYETLYLNFLNTTTVTDEDTNTNYPLAASYITTNINTGTQTNCTNTSVGKIRINKSTPVYQNIYWDAIDNTHKQTMITLYIDELIPSIDFISNDESTVYLTIDTSSFEVGNYYTITQYLRVE